MATTESKLRDLLKMQTIEFWGNAYTFQPHLLNKVYGDGKRLLQLFPISERPRYWVVRVDSGFYGVWEILDDIYEQIDEQFGCPNEDDLGVGNERPYFPMFDGEGVWWRLVPGTAPAAGLGDVAG